MATCDLPVRETENPSAAALHQLKELLERDSAFAQALGATPTTEAAAKLAAEHGVVVTPEALWRHRGTLVSGGLPTWRGGSGDGGGDRAIVPIRGDRSSSIRVIVADSALESAMSGGNLQPPVAPMASDQQSGAGRDVFSQLLRTRQWEADGSHLLRPAAFHALAAGCWTVPH